MPTLPHPAPRPSAPGAAPAPQSAPNVPPLPSLAAYAAQLRAADRAASTVEKYLRDIEAFFAWLGADPLTPESPPAWKAHLLALGRAPGTVNGMLIALNGYLRFAGRPDCRARLLRVQRRTFRDRDRTLTRAEYDRLLAAARAKGDARLALLLETICSTGIRVSEVRYITLAAARKGRAEISLKGKIRTILLPGKLCRKLQSYAQKQGATGEIFTTKTGNSLSRRQIWAQMKRLCKAARVAPGKVFPHNLRHLFATIFYAASKDIVRLADVLGHSSLETTRIYLLTTGIEHARQLDRLGLVS